MALGFGVEAEVTYRRRIAPVVNASGPTEVARAAAARAGRALAAFPPSTAGDDFAELSARVPGCFAWIGNGPARDGALHHNTRYDFNDAAIPTGVRWWVEVVRGELGA